MRHVAVTGGDLLRGRVAGLIRLLVQDSNLLQQVISGFQLPLPHTQLLNLIGDLSQLSLNVLSPFLHMPSACSDLGNLRLPKGADLC